MSAYYNEIDPYAAQWLRNLIAANLIAPGDVDERSIQDVSADDLRGYQQCHFFAGIGGWSVALRLARWPDDRPVWTGSCPCQPFSAAGAGKAANDERHLWPAWFPLITECRPAIIFGEQVEAAIGWGWLDAVFDDLEKEGYTCGEAVLPACSVGAFHIRQRAWFVGKSMCAAGEWRTGSVFGEKTESGRQGQFNGSNDHRFADAGKTSIMADSASAGTERDARKEESSRRSPRIELEKCGELSRMADSAEPRRQAAREHNGSQSLLSARSAKHGRTGALAISSSTERGTRRSERSGENGSGTCSQFARSGDAFGWLDSWACEWLPCTDGKARPVRPGSFPLAHGIQRRAPKLRAYGNAIVPQVAAEFIAACSEIV